MFRQIKYTLQNDIWHVLCRLSYFLTAQQACCLYAVSKTLSLKWKPHRAVSRFPLFIAGMDTSETLLASVYILSTSVGSGTHAIMY